MKTYNLQHELRDPLYGKVLDLAKTRCQWVLLVIRSSLKVDDGCTQLLERLEPFLEREFESPEWPGTKLLVGTASVMHYKLESECVNILKSTTTSLYDWQQPRLPEDLCLLRANGDPYLVSISHESDGYFLLSPEEKEELIRSIPDIQSFLEAGTE